MVPETKGPKPHGNKTLTKQESRLGVDEGRRGQTNTILLTAIQNKIRGTRETFGNLKQR